MVKKMRSKFVFVTMLLMLSVLGIVVFINYIDNFYWQKVDTEELLQWFVDNTTRVDANFK